MSAAQRDSGLSRNALLKTNAWILKVKFLLRVRDPRTAFAMVSFDSRNGLCSSAKKNAFFTSAT